MNNTNKEIINTDKNKEIKSSPNLLSSENMKRYLIVLGVIFGIIGIFYLISFTFRINIAPNLGGNLGGNPPQGGGRPQVGRGPTPGLRVNIWPIWGYFSLPNIFGLMISIGLFVSFFFFIKYIYKNEVNLNIYLTTLIGILLIIGSNLINGWNQGIAGAISQDITQGGELFNDAIKINNLCQFISNYENLQPTLGVHSKTHPPGAVISIYLVYLVFKDPGLIAIALCVIATLLSVYFLNGIYKRYFEENHKNYMIFLFLLLPAVQIYYLANIYALVVAFILGVIYYYYHPNKKKRIIGSIICLFFATFISFMAGFIVLCLFIFELLRTWKIKDFKDENNRKAKFIDYIKNLQKLIIITLGLMAIYGLFLVVFGFNYLNAFFYAAQSESGGGFILFTNPLRYIATRVGDILDILIFFGPILIVLCYYGFKTLKKDSGISKDSLQMYLLALSAIIALLIIFLTGAYDHGETARAAIYIYPFLLLPVAIYLKNENFSQNEKKK
ncbi:MAG: hypothetical protein ACFFAO_20995, partial [Candidatus Hermodarchaeota archaeon]